MFIHLYPEICRSLGIGPRYSSLLAKALQSRDAELLVCIGEELMKGHKLASDVALANRFFDRADELSSFMGSYAMALLVSNQNPDLAITLFRKGERAGHIASSIRRHNITSRRIPLIGFLIRSLLALKDTLVALRAINSSNVNLRFWRYRDVYRNPLDVVDQKIGADRATPFSDIESESIGLD